MLVFGHDREIAEWVSRRLKFVDFGPSVAIGIVRHDHLVGGCVFHNWRHPNIEVSFAATSPTWATRQTFRALLNYPFRQVQCRRLTATTEVTNQPARAFLCRFGFHEEGYHPEALPGGVDAVTYGLLARNCRWLAEEIPSDQIVSVAAACA